MTYNVYRISKVYTDTLRQAGYNVSNETNRYCGPVYKTTDNGKELSFFAPVNNGYNSKKCYALTFHNNILAGLIDFNKMIPCFENFLKTESDDLDIADFCKDNESFIKMCADFVVEHNMAER